jgi:hypothetical protein
MNSPTNSADEAYFETGLDPSSEIEVFVLCKVAAGQEIVPSVRMNGPVGIGFEEFNPQPRFRIAAPSPLDSAKVALMPGMVRATAATDKVVIFWDIPQDSDYRGMKIFRSQERPLGDFESIGEKIFDGYGITNAFEFHRASRPNDEIATQSPNYSRFLHGLPLQPQAKPPTNGPSNIPLLKPPTGLQVNAVSRSQHWDGKLAHFVERPPQRNTAYTYTLYTEDRTGRVSYPIMVNASLNDFGTNCTFVVKP